MREHDATTWAVVIIGILVMLGVYVAGIVSLIRDARQWKK